MNEQIRRTKPSGVAALGYSNGANILASVLFSNPAPIDAAVLMHPLIPFAPPPQAELAGRRILITAGRRDPIAPVAMTEQLEAYFRSQGAISSVAWHDGGHEIRPSEVAAASGVLES
jgi:phospholipase/carboxylesterase